MDEQVAQEILGIREQYENNKAQVLQSLIDVVIDVKLDVPSVVKAKFNVQQRPEEWNDDGIM